MSLIDDIIVQNEKLGTYGSFIARIYAGYYRLEKMFSMSRLFQDVNFINYTDELSRIKMSNDSKVHILDKIHTYYLDKFNNAKERQKVLLYFAILKRIDELLENEDNIRMLRYATYAGDDVEKYESMYHSKGNKGILIIGKRIWSENRFTEGNCPFNNIRFIVLSATEYDKFIRHTPLTENLCIFNENGEYKTEVLVSHSNMDYKFSTTDERRLVHNNYGFRLNINGLIDEKQSDEAKFDEGCSKATNHAIKEAIQNCTESTNILVFPEVMITQSELDGVINLFDSCKEKNFLNVKLIVIGVYRKREIGYDNLAVVLIKRNEKWDKLTEYKKIIPSSFANTIDMNGIKTCNTAHQLKTVIQVEDLNKANMNEDLSIIMCQDCVIGVAICRDALDILNLDSPLHRYADTVDILIVISLNKADTNMFMGSAECLSRWHNCGVVYTNNISVCNSETKLIEVSFALTPFKGEKAGTTSLTGVVCYRNCLIKPNGSDEDIMPVVYKEISDYNTVVAYTLQANGKVETRLI